MQPLQGGSGSLYGLSGGFVALRSTVWSLQALSDALYSFRWSCVNQVVYMGSVAPGWAL